MHGGCITQNSTLDDIGASVAWSLYLLNLLVASLNICLASDHSFSMAKHNDASIWI